MNLKSRVDRLNEKANWLLRENKSDILVLIVPIDNDKGYFIDICNNYKTGYEATSLRQRLEACNTFDELSEQLQGYETDAPGLKRSNDYMR